MTNNETLIQLFIELAGIPGKSLNEAALAAHIRRRLDGLPFTVETDDAGRALGGNTGNLLIKPAHFDPAKPVRVYMAHMDTVRDTTGIGILRDKGKITSDGTSQLGADNRAGVAVLLQLLLDVTLSPPNYMVVFTIAEEIGLKGAELLDFGGLDVEAVFVFDSSRRPGALPSAPAPANFFVSKPVLKGRACTQRRWAPRRGISDPLWSAAEALQAALPLGKLDED